jgi:eukaryotic-like serine/threonine-protein kinase
MAFTPGTRIGAYEIVAPLGAGGMGEVYRARDTKLGRDVALKVLPDAFAADIERMARFEREAKVLAALNHPNIGAIYGLEERALVLELVEGENLAGPLPVETAVRYALQIASALEAAHEKGIVHRDLKPANIKVTPAGVIKVLDFGLAAVGQPGGGQGHVTQSPTITLSATQAGVILGTAAYMAPEQAGGKVVDKRADIWAFGCVLYEMLAGRQTFHGESVVDILGAVVRAEPEWSRLPADMPENVRRVLRHCLEKDPASRLRDIGDARLELAEPIDVRTSVPAAVTRRTASAWALGGVAAIAGAVGYFSRSLWTAADVKPKNVRWFKLSLGDTRLTNLLRISRDGSRIAYVFNNSVNLNQRPVFVREFDSPTPRRVNGTDVADTLVFSPDGKWVAFSAALAVFKVSVTGGDPVHLADGWYPTDWTADGRLLLTTRAPGQGVTAISANGGKQQQLVKAGPGEIVGSATLLPTGKTLLYESRISGPQAVVQSPGGSDRKVVVENARTPVYLRSGHILFRREDGWCVVPFDVKALYTSGPVVSVPAPIATAEQLAIDDYGTAVFTSQTAFTRASQLLIVDRQGKTAEALKTTEPFTQLRAAPDGRSLVLSHQGSGDVFTYDIKRGIQTRMTFEPGEDETPVWSPDGKRFAYASVRSGQNRHIVIRNADGSAGEQIVWTTESHVHVDDWSPDGKFLLATRSGVLSDILVLAADSAGQPKLFLESPFAKLNAAVSPDGHWIAYVSNETKTHEIYVRPWPGPGGKWQVSADGGARPRWSRNGKELFYNSKGGMMAVPVDGKGQFSTGKPQLLFQRTFGDYDVLPDGRFVLFDAPPALGMSELDVVENWFEELKRIAPAGQ